MTLGAAGVIPASRTGATPATCRLCVSVSFTYRKSQCGALRLKLLFLLSRRWVVLFLPGGAALSLSPDSFTDSPLHFSSGELLSLPPLLRVKPSHFSLTSSFLLLSLSPATLPPSHPPVPLPHPVCRTRGKVAQMMMMMMMMMMSSWRLPSQKLLKLIYSSSFSSPVFLFLFLSFFLFFFDKSQLTCVEIQACVLIWNDLMSTASYRIQ